MFEIESKYPLEDVDKFESKIIAMGGVAKASETHADHYFNHPAKDFAETGEAFRVRMIDGVGHVTYKGKKRDGVVKVRQEIEWQLGGQDVDGKKLRELLVILDFRPVAIVRKTRRKFELTHNGADYELTIDDAESVGQFAEIERLVETESQIDAARRGIEDLAVMFGLGLPETRSYLTMLLQRSDRL